MRFTKKTLPFLFLFLGGANICVAAQPARPLPSECRQIIVAITPSWDSPKAHLAGFQRSNTGAWQKEFGPVPALLGKRGSAWGIGIAGQGQPGLQKREKDWRAPAGIFRIGLLYTYDKTPPNGIKYPYYTVTARDVWISDPKSSNYNQHLTVDLKHPPSWYLKERMRLGDFAHRYMLEIRHNADNPVPGAGSAIFFHIRRGSNIPSSGCTVLAQEDLLRLLRWLRTKDSPCYVLLPWQVYKEQWQAWKLPNPTLVSQLASDSL